MATTLFPDGGLRLQDGTQRPMLLPVGVTAPTNAAHIVSFELSSGEVITVGSVSELLRLAHAMRAEGLYSIMPTEDLFIVLAGAAKLLICESSFQNLENRYDPNDVFFCRRRRRERRIPFVFRRPLNFSSCGQMSCCIPSWAS